MPTIGQFILSAFIKGLPLLIIIISSGIYAVRRKSIAGGMVALGCLAISVLSIWSTFAPVWVRTHTAGEYGRIMMQLSMCSTAGWYIASIGIACILLNRGSQEEDSLVHNDMAIRAAARHQKSR